MAPRPSSFAALRQYGLWAVWIEGERVVSVAETPLDAIAAALEELPRDFAGEILSAAFDAPTLGAVRYGPATQRLADRVAARGAAVAHRWDGAQLDLRVG